MNSISIFLWFFPILTDPEKWHGQYNQTLLEINVSWNSILRFCNNAQCSFHSQYFPIDQTAIFILIAIYNLFFTHIFGNFLKQDIIAFTVMLLFFEYKIEPCRFPNSWLRRLMELLLCSVVPLEYDASLYKFISSANKLL
jgi:hypothetical protein